MVQLKRPWQDHALALAQCIFFFGLMPSVAADTPPAWQTSLSVASGLLLILSVNISQRWWWASAWTVLTIVAWLTLFVQAVA